MEASHTRSPPPHGSQVAPGCSPAQPGHRGALRLLRRVDEHAGTAPGPTSPSSARWRSRCPSTCCCSSATPAPPRCSFRWWSAATSSGKAAPKAGVLRLEPHVARGARHEVHAHPGLPGLGPAAQGGLPKDVPDKRAAVPRNDAGGDDGLGPIPWTLSEAS